jgi:hypothetical protein
VVRLIVVMIHAAVIVFLASLLFTLICLWLAVLALRRLYGWWQSTRHGYRVTTVSHG